MVFRGPLVTLITLLRFHAIAQKNWNSSQGEDQNSPQSTRFTKKLKIFAPDAYDLVLSKLERNSPKDQGDVEYLTKAVPLDPKILRDRYEKELRPNLMARESWHDGTLEMWIGSYFSTHG